MYKYYCIQNEHGEYLADTVFEIFFREDVHYIKKYTSRSRAIEKIEELKRDIHKDFGKLEVVIMEINFKKE